MSQQEPKTRRVKAPDAAPEPNTLPGASTGLSLWRVLLPLRHGQTVDGKRISRTWQPGQTIELTPAQAAPLLARRVIEEQKP